MFPFDCVPVLGTNVKIKHKKYKTYTCQIASIKKGKISKDHCKDYSITTSLSFRTLIILFIRLIKTYSGYLFIGFVKYC